MALRIPVPKALEDMKGLVYDAIVVPVDSNLEAMRLLHPHAGLVAEPSGVVGVAALPENKTFGERKTKATITCGGNVTNHDLKPGSREAANFLHTIVFSKIQAGGYGGLFAVS